MEIPLNLLAILASAVASIVLGFLWYGPLFGKPWRKLMGVSEGSMKQTSGMGKTYALMILGSLLMAFVLAHNIIFGVAFTKITGVSGGLQGGFWNWLGFAVPLLMDGQLWEKKPWKLFWINAGYRLVSFLIMGVILATWTA
jgi:hypothetical protein